MKNYALKICILCGALGYVVSGDMVCYVCKKKAQWDEEKEVEGAVI